MLIRTTWETTTKMRFLPSFLVLPSSFLRCSCKLLIACLNWSMPLRCFWSSSWRCRCFPFYHKLQWLPCWSLHPSGWHQWVILPCYGEMIEEVAFFWWWPLAFVFLEDANRVLMGGGCCGAARELWQSPSELTSPSRWVLNFINIDICIYVFQSKCGYLGTVFHHQFAHYLQHPGSARDPEIFDAWVLLAHVWMIQKPGVSVAEGSRFRCYRWRSMTQRNDVSLSLKKMERM